MDFYMVVSQLFPKKKSWEFPRDLPKKSQRLGGDLLHLVVGDCRDSNGWVEHVRETPSIFQHMFIYIYICVP